MNQRPQETEWLAQLRCRNITEDDLPALEWDGEYINFRRLYREVYQSACQGKAVLWLAELPGVNVIGQVFVQLHSARLELADGHKRAYIYGFRIKPAYRGFGVGARLLHAAEVDLCQRGFEWVTLNVGRDNPNARRFYERYGYYVVAAEAGRWHYLDHEGQRRDVHEPAWRMQKRLKSGC
ncbi:MAG: GNAT family N-acetyltransferase [Chloroflexota bacterium]